MGDYGTILHYDGKSWNKSPSGTTLDLQGSTASGPKTLLRWATKVWFCTSMAVTGIASTVAQKKRCFRRGRAGAGDVWMVSRRGSVLHFDGKSIKKASASVSDY